MRMKHPVHGFHVPMPGERESMLKNGWVDDVEAPELVRQGTEDVERFNKLAEAAPAIKRGPGRPRKAA